MVNANENKVALPAGYDSAEELYAVTHASVGLLLADFDLGMATAEETLKKIREARKEAADYTLAVFEAE